MKDILVIDDAVVMRAMLTDVLGKAGYAVHVAVGFETAIAALDAKRPDLILLDLNFKGGTAEGVVQHIRRRYGGRVAIVGMSGDGRLLQRCADEGLFHYGIIKPFEKDELLKLLADALTDIAARADEPEDEEASDEDDEDSMQISFPETDPLTADPEIAMRGGTPLSPPPREAVERAMAALNSNAPNSADELMAARAAARDSDHLEDEDDFDLAARVLAHPEVRRAMRRALDDIMPATPVVRVPAGIAPMGAVLRWLLGQEGATRYEVTASHPEGLVVVYVWDGQVLGVASDSWAQDERVEAIRGRVLPPPGDDGVQQQREILEWAGANARWVDVKRHPPNKTAPLWTIGQPSAFHELTAISLSLSTGRMD